MRAISKIGWSFTLAALLLTMSCTKPAPKGQVLADVDGIDVTRRDLAAEVAARGGDADPTATLNHIIDRTLLTHAAHAMAIDLSPEYLAALRRGRDQLLADMYVQRVARSLPAASPAEVSAYIDAHPFTFERRILVDVLRLDAPANPAARAALAGVSDMSAAVAALSALKLAVTPAAQTLDSASIAPDFAQRLSQAGAGLLVEQSASGLAAYKVVTQRTAALSHPVAETAARRAIAAARLTQMISDQINVQRFRARIRYQSGFGSANSTGG